MRVPVRKANESPTTAMFTLHSSPPFALGAIRSVNSKLQYRQPADKHRDKIAGYPTQAIAKQTPYFPNYEVVKNKGKHLLARYCTADGVRELKTLFQSRPWDVMWEGRVVVFFLVDPTQLSDPQVEWIFKRIRFQYEYRQVFWLLTHWLYIARTPGAEQSRTWSNLWANREGLKKLLRAKSAQIDSEAPPGTCTALLQSEPALWVEPRKPCPWALEEFDEGSSAIEQVQALDDVEPIRCYWAGHHGRFVEALLPDQLTIMDGHGGQCWELPPPWNDPKYTPLPLDQVTPGTPGPDYLFQDPRTTSQATPLAE